MIAAEVANIASPESPLMPPRNRPSAQKIALAGIQGNIERVLADYSNSIDALDILAVIADAFDYSNNAATAAELRDLQIKLAGYREGIEKPFRI
jgi:hypothetical protein